MKFTKNHKQGIKSIILDLGGVLLNINYNKTVEAFKAIGVPSFEKVFNQFKQNNISDLFETGKVSGDEFYKSVRGNSDITREQFDIAWNAMLLDFPKIRMEIIKALSKDFNLYLCSNTNAIHYRAFISVVNQYEEDFERIFDSVYYSHKVGFRKPNANIFKHILKENSLLTEETLFLDDSIQHIEGANAVGINTIHVQEKPIEKIFADWL